MDLSIAKEIIEIPGFGEVVFGTDECVGASLV